MRIDVALAALILLTAVAGVIPAAADQGVSINLGSIKINEPLIRGQDYRLPEMEVSNPGMDTSTYLMEVRAVRDQDALPLDRGWFSLNPERFELGPGDSQVVLMVLHVPDDASLGAYGGLVGASIVPARQGASVGAAAAAKLTFEVARPDSIISPLASWLKENPLIVYGLTALVVASLAARVLRRKFTFSIERR